MRFDDGERELREVGLHLTLDEARRVHEALDSLIDDVARLDFETTHGGVGDLSLYLSLDAATQLTDFEEKLEP